MINKDKMPAVIGVAFVWFTTQFGGGFASGAQLKSFFVSFGIWCLITPILTQLFGAFFQWYGLKFAKKHEVYDYRSYNNKFYGRFAPIFSNLYELIYVFTICVASAVAFATGGSTMNQLTGVPYLLCTAVIGIFIFLVAIYGTNVVRKVASTLSVLIIVGLLLIFVPNIIAQWGSIAANISDMATHPAPIGPALFKALIYASFQLASIGLLVQHAKPFNSPDDAKQGMIWGFIVNAVIISLSVLGLLAVVTHPSYADAKVPILVLVQNGVGSSVLTPIISLLIILGSVSTAVNMIAGMTNRVCVSLDKNFDPTDKPGLKVYIVTGICTFVAFAIAQFGLLPLVAKGYGFLGYLTIPVVVIPYIVHMIVTKFDTKNVA